MGGIYIKKEEKPKAPIIGADGNVYNLMGICSKVLRRAGYGKQAKEMVSRIKTSKNYDEALAIMLDYVIPVDQYGKPFEETETFEEDMYI